MFGNGMDVPYGILTLDYVSPSGDIRDLRTYYIYEVVGPDGTQVFKSPNYKKCMDERSRLTSEYYGERTV